MQCIARPRVFSHRFSRTSVRRACRAIVYEQNGSPNSVLTSLTYPSLPPPRANTLNVKFLLSPINPADVNVIEGVYPVTPIPRTTLASSGRGSVFIAGNEGLAQVTQVGNGVTGFEVGEWVIFTKQQHGTWVSGTNIDPEDVLKIPREVGVVNGAVMTVCALSMEEQCFSNL
jgi:trans-2-enoyl-CoA reductase